MIFIALGANLPSSHGTPEETLEAAKIALEARGVRVIRSAQTILSPPWPPSEGAQPWYRNSVIAIETDLEPLALLGLLHDVEREFGRVRGAKNAPRRLDLDLIAYNDEIIDRNGVQIPHPRLHERGFVLYPLREIDAEWVHPILKRTVNALIEGLPDDQHDIKLAGNSVPAIDVSERGAA